jgi:hypothetical protein
MVAQPSPAIDVNILSALQVLFQRELITNLVGDPGALRTLKQMDLQDDPTLTAPYLTYAPEKEKSITLISGGEQEKLYGSAEIGGPIRYLHHYRATFGTPQQPTRDTARAMITTLGKRIRNAIILGSDLSNLLTSGQLQSADESEYIEGQNYLLVPTLIYDIFGGESTFYGKGEIHWVYPVSYQVPGRLALY